MKWILPLLSTVALLTVPAWSRGANQPVDDGAAPAKVAKLPKCPVMDKPVSFRISTMTDDGPVYFCCKMCVRKFDETPAKYADGVRAQWTALAERERVQVSCPLSGEPIDKKVYTGDGDQRVYFCCENCKTDYAKAPAKYAAKLAASYTYQTRCPVMGGKIDPTSFTDLPTGERIYFCCPGCDNKFLAEPQRYAAKLDAQGSPINVEKLEKALQDAKKP